MKYRGDDQTRWLRALMDYVHFAEFSRNDGHFTKLFPYGAFRDNLWRLWRWNREHHPNHHKE